MKSYFLSALALFASTDSHATNSKEKARQPSAAKLDGAFRSKVCREIMDFLDYEDASLKLCKTGRFNVLEEDTTGDRTVVVFQWTGKLSPGQTKSETCDGFAVRENLGSTQRGRKLWRWSQTQIDECR